MNSANCATYNYIMFGTLFVISAPSSLFESSLFAFTLTFRSLLSSSKTLYKRLLLLKRRHFFFSLNRD